MKLNRQNIQTVHPVATDPSLPIITNRESFISSNLTVTPSSIAPSTSPFPANFVNSLQNQQQMMMMLPNPTIMQVCIPQLTSRNTNQQTIQSLQRQIRPLSPSTLIQQSRLSQHSVVNPSRTLPAYKKRSCKICSSQSCPGKTNRLNCKNISINF